MIKVNVLLAAAAVLVMSTSAHATNVTRTFDIVASHFNFGFGDSSVSPIEPVDLDFTITLDPSTVVPRTTSGLTINAFNLPYALTYAYDGAGSLTVATEADLDACGNPALSFCTFIDHAFGSAITSFVEQSTRTGGFYTAQSIRLTTSATVFATPEPAAWALMLVGFCGIGGALRLRRSVAFAV